MNTAKVTWSQLAILITVLVASFTAVWTAISSVQKDINQVKVDVATTKTDVSWLRSEFERVTGGGQISSTGQSSNLLDRMYVK